GAFGVQACTRFRTLRGNFALKEDRFLSLEFQDITTPEILVALRKISGRLPPVASKLPDAVTNTMRAPITVASVAREIEVRSEMDCVPVPDHLKSFMEAPGAASQTAAGRLEDQEKEAALRRLLATPAQSISSITCRSRG